MNNIAIIPARGGSKRIPHKNIKPFLGKPIIAYSIDAALKSGLFDEIMVSTDDLEIAKIAIQYGAKVPFMRSEATSNDFAIISDVLTEVINCYQQQNINFENICCILPTAPLISSTDIINAFHKLNNSDFTSVYPVVAFSYPIMRSLIMNEQGLVKMRWPEFYKTRSQDLEPAYHDSGTFYWMKTESLLNSNGEFLQNAGAIIMDELKIQDIDTETDWKLAELKYKLLH